MLTLELNGKHGKFKVNLPTALDELTEEYLKDVTKQVVIAPNYSLIGIVFKEKLSTIVLASRSKKDNKGISVIPIFIKAGKCYDEFIYTLNTGDRLVISNSDIMLGQHISTPANKLTINEFLALGEGDAELYQKAASNNEYCYFVEFKLVPNCNIHGSYNDSFTSNNANPFIVKL